MLCALGPFWVIVATTSVGFRVEMGEARAKHEVFLPGSGSGWNAKILGDRSLALDRDKNLHASRERLVPIPYAWWVYGGVFPVRMLDPS